MEVELLKTNVFVHEHTALIHPRCRKPLDLWFKCRTSTFSRKQVAPLKNYPNHSHTPPRRYTCF